MEKWKNFSARVWAEILDARSTAVSAAGKFKSWLGDGVRLAKHDADAVMLVLLIVAALAAVLILPAAAVAAFYLITVAVVLIALLVVAAVLYVVVLVAVAIGSAAVGIVRPTAPTAAKTATGE